MRPSDRTHVDQSLWVTIDCLGGPPDENTKSTLRAQYEDRRTWLGDRSCRVAESGELNDIDLVVKVCDFTKAEFLEWVKVWLRAKGLAATELIPAPPEEFTGTHPHADLLTRLTRYRTGRARRPEDSVRPLAP